MIFSQKKTFLIIGETSALYCHGTEQKLLNDPKDLKSLKWTSPLDIFIDFPGAIYRTHTYPKLSRFERRAAIQNHPHLQEKDLLSASAKITEKGDLNLCLLKNSDFLTRWLKALSLNNIPLKNVKALPFHKTYQSPTKALYQIEKTHDGRARHTCLIDGALTFVRYTNLDENWRTEIERTIHFIQRDYALKRSDIHVQNDIKTSEISQGFSKDKIFHWQWLNRLPKKLSDDVKILAQTRWLRHSAHGARIASLSLIAGSSLFFITSVVTYVSTTSTATRILHSKSTLPHSLQHLSRQQLQHLIWIDQNSQTPFNALKILQRQEDKTLKLEEFHWQKINAHTQRIRLSINHHQQKRKQDRQDYLTRLFTVPPTVLSSDGQVDRFEIILVKKGASS